MAVEDYDMSFLEAGLDQDVTNDFRSDFQSILDETFDKIDVLMGQEAGARRSLQSSRCGLACGACRLACDISTGPAETACLAGALLVCIFPGSACRAARAICRAPGNACRGACAL